MMLEGLPMPIGGRKMNRIHRTAGIGTAIVVAAAFLVLAPCVTLRAQNILTPDKLSSGATTPQTVNEQIRSSAVAQQARGTAAARFGLYTITWAKDAAEFDALAQNAVLMMTAITQTQAELPIKRVYLVTPDGKQTTLRQLNTWRGSIGAKTLAYTQLGKFLQDAFYLIPAAAVKRAGEIQIDFAINRVGFVLVHLPTLPQDLGYEPRDPVPGAQVDNAALHAMMLREFPGFPLPKP
jgi:hypothetical protein